MGQKLNEEENDGPKVENTQCTQNYVRVCRLFYFTTTMPSNKSHLTWSENATRTVGVRQAKYSIVFCRFLDHLYTPFCYINIKYAWSRCTRARALQYFDLPFLHYKIVGFRSVYGHYVQWVHRNLRVHSATVLILMWKYNSVDLQILYCTVSGRYWDDGNSNA